MDLQMFRGFDGRIGRQTWWIGTLIMIAVSIVLYFVLGTVMGSGLSSVDPQAVLEPGYLEGYMRKMALSQLIILAIVAYPVTALMAKRLNDRDRPSWFKWLFWAPTALNLILTFAGLTMTTTDMGGVTVPMPTMLSSILGVANAIIGIWALIELGILKGTTGPNRHGPDPLAA